MADTKTGDGGFEIDGKTYVFDVDDPAAPGVDPVPTDPGDIKVDNSPKDISKKTKTTLAQYLKNITQVNQFPIDKNAAATVVDGTLTDAQSNVPVPLPGGPSNDPQFSTPEKSKGVVSDSPDLRQTSDVPLTDPASKLDTLSKGKEFPQQTNGNQLLSSVQKAAQISDLDEPLKSYAQVNAQNNQPLVEKAQETSLDKNVDDHSKFAAGLTKDGGNTYPVDSKKLTEHSITDAEHNVPAPLPTSPSNDPQFADPKTVSGVVPDAPADKRIAGSLDFLGQPPPSLLGRHTSDTLVDPAGTLSDLTKGKKFPKKSDGNALLPSVQKDKLPEPVNSYTSAVLSNNRFTAAAPDAGSYRIGEKTYTSSELKQVGVMLSLRGSQEFPAAFNDSVNPVNAGSVAGALIPSPNQIGVLKVPLRLLEARDALEHLADNDEDAPAETTTAPIGGQSWGALNNVEEPWSGTLNLGMIAMALALQVAMILAFEGLGALIGLGPSSPPSVARNPNGTYTKGSYLAKPLSDPNKVGFPPDVKAIFGIHGTRFPFGSALRVGSKAFFVGAEKAKESLGASLLSTVTSAASDSLSDNSSAGFMIIVSRLIIRTGQAVAAHVEKIAAAFASNPISGIKAINGLLDMIKQSKLIAAINIFTTLGDAILSEREFGKDITDPESKSEFSDIDAADADAPKASVTKSRLKNPKDPSGNQLKLAWSSNRAPAMYLLPDSVAIMGLVDTKLGGFRGPLGIEDPNTRNYLVIQEESSRKQDGARIPRDSLTPDGVDVKKLEQLLESEYMPFYFHDLRTNEIVGFHAFLASLSDDYTANWETIEGYGRVDPVKIYKSTNRRISMSFYVAALDEKDFDDMWLKINKLVTLVYPQYTRGRQLKTEGGVDSFIQPFSQLIGASPLIRIRLGDLFRSNYSRFALARLFGAADGDMKLDGTDVKFKGTVNIIKDPKAVKQIFETIQKALGNPGSEYTLTSVGWPSAIESGGAAIGVGGPSTPDQAPNMKIDAGDISYFKFKIKKKLGNGMVAVEPIIRDTIDLASYGIFGEAATSLIANLTEKYGEKASADRKVIGGQSGYAVPQHALRLTPKTLKQIFKDATGISDAIQSIESLATFLDVEKNALVKSFRSVQGKGLAGVIESMSFDWYDRVTWDDRPNHRAPKMCKVTLSFAPIHDISPGIDHLGYNRSPVYPVGSAMGQGFDPDKTG